MAFVSLQNRILFSLNFPFLTRLQNNPQSQFKSYHLNHSNSNTRCVANRILLSTISSSSASVSSSAAAAAAARAKTKAINIIHDQPDADTEADDVQVQPPTTFSNSPTSTSWAEFAKNVSGEWDGYGADFSIQGKPIELPESVVPEAYREWEVKVFDWQTQCPTLAEPDHFPIAKYKLIKLLPTVGCEADAATRYSIDDRNVGGADNKVAAFAYQSTGCYVAVWPIEDRGTHRVIELEHCLTDPRDRKSRVRIVQVVRVEENCRMLLQKISVFSEQWYGPFRNGEQLGGCAIRDSAFASTDALNSSQVTGVWQGLNNAIAIFQNTRNNICQELVDDSVSESVRYEHNLILLPKKLWCSLKESKDGETSCEVGWLLDQGRAITSKCTFLSNLDLKEIAVACEAAGSAQ